MSLALWLRAGRAHKGFSLEDVAKITKIQARILERLEAGKLDGLPAEVFVRGFIRSVAKCVGLDESEALTRYSAAQGSPTTIPTATPSAVAFVESMSDLAPTTSSLLAPVVLVSNPPLFPAGSIERLPANAGEIDDELDDVEIDVESLMLAGAPVEAPAKTASVVSNAVDARIEAVAPARAAVEPAQIAVVLPTMIEPANVESADAVLDATPADAAPVETTGKKKRVRKPRGTAAPKGKRKAMATGTPSSAIPVVVASDGASGAVVNAVVEIAAIESATVVANAAAANQSAADVETVALERSAVGVNVAVESDAVDGAQVTCDLAPSVGVAIESTAADELFGASSTTMIDASDLVDATSEARTTSSELEPATSGTWKPSMPAVTASSVPWRRPSLGIYATSTAPVVPTLVIDDSDPETAASQQDDRAQSNVPRRSFLPPILAERAKNAASGQGTLTLAVIILLIAATLTLSYLMRRPSSSGDGVTRADGTALLIG
ncbi:MAG: helix-turn-helix domain-containing protein [Kofleriaceae bacterium]